jgi:hypothetical protein
MLKKKTDLQKRQQKLGRVYFTEETEKSIIQYNEMQDELDKEIIFREKIYPALDKLVENVINRFKFPYIDGSFDDIKNQVVSFLVLNLHKFTSDKGKAFSYFSVVAKNYLILHNNNAYRDQKKTSHFTSYNEDDFSYLEERFLIDDDLESKKIDAKDFIHLMVQYWEHNLTKIFKKQKDLQIADAVVELLRRHNSLESFNKKILYILIREMTDAKTSHITKVINKMKFYVNMQLKEYKKTGYISDPSIFFSYKNK